MKFYKILLVCAALSIANFHIHAEVLPNDSVFLKCTDWYRLGEDADQIELKQKLFIVIPDRFLYTLDDNLNWVKRRTTVDFPVRKFSSRCNFLLWRPTANGVSSKTR